MSSQEEENYYINKKEIYLRQFDAALALSKPIFSDYFGKDRFKTISSKVKADFENLIPQIPYVGGDDNFLTESLVSSALLLPILRFFEEEGLNFDEISELTYKMFEIFYKFIPRANDTFSEEFINIVKEGAQKSKLKQYDGDWIYDFVDGEGEDFTYGVDYHECGVYKFYKVQGLEHLMPIVCVSDFAQARAYGYGLSRTQTIGNGASLCDFRYIKDGESPKGWPLQNLPEYKKSKD